MFPLNVDREGKHPWPAIALTDQHPVGCDRQQRQHGTAGQSKFTLEGTSTQLADLEAKTEGLEDSTELSGGRKFQIHGRIIRGILGVPSWVVRIHQPANPQCADCSAV